MDWSPLSDDELLALIAKSTAVMDPETQSLWNQIRVPPIKWQLSPWGDKGGGFWVVALLGEHVVWFNDIEEGFNVSRYAAPGVISDYWCNQEELHNAVRGLLTKISN